MPPCTSQCTETARSASIPVISSSSSTCEFGRLSGKDERDLRIVSVPHSYNLGLVNFVRSLRRDGRRIRLGIERSGAARDRHSFPMDILLVRRLYATIVICRSTWARRGHCLIVWTKSLLASVSGVLYRRALMTDVMHRYVLLVIWMLYEFRGDNRGDFFIVGAIF